MQEPTPNEFAKYENEVAESVKTVKERIKKEKDTRRYIRFGDYQCVKLRAEITAAAQKSLGAVSVGEINLTLPPPHVFGDLAFEVFDLAKKLKKNPEEIAQKIANDLKSRAKAEEGNLIKDAFAVGGFVNIETRRENLYRDILAQILELGESYGESDLNAGKTALIDYSGPNIAKPIGVGHMRSTVIGQALVNIYRKTGYSVIKDNHLGDWGTQFGALIYAYQEWGDEKKIAANPIEELKNLYVQFHQFAKEHPEVKDKARELFASLEKKDPGLIALWKRFRDLSLEDFALVYKRLGIEFDTYIGESYFTSQADKLAEECLEKGFCRKDDTSEALIVDEINDLPSFLIRKGDGATLYLTRDLATLHFRLKTFHPQTILYVVGQEQNLNFKQLFTFAKHISYLSEHTEAKHISFGLVLNGGKKMSTREGTLIELKSLIEQAVKKSQEILLQKNPDIKPEELNEESEIIGLGAIVYNDLRQSRIKNISFDWTRMLSLESGSAIYLQYSYVRINSIVKKLKEVYGETGVEELKPDDISFEKQSEFMLAKQLMFFPEIIAKAQASDSPHHICGYLEELALLFNNFYEEVSLLKTENEKLRASRMALCRSISLVIKEGLNLLGVRVPEKM